jgi:tetratricopeptide (TPR) repeat protein
MHCSPEGALKWAPTRAQVRATKPARLRIVQFLLPMVSGVLFALPLCSQDSGSLDKELHGSGAEITVTVHDSSGQPISSVALVKLLRNGAIPSRQSETSHGRAVLVVNNLGEFTVIVEAAGYEIAQKEVSVSANGRSDLEVYLRRSSPSATPTGIPGRPVLAPKAKEALERGLRSLSAGKMIEAETSVGEAMRLAPGHPDVLYVQGVLYLKQRKWPEAQDALEKATQIDQSYARAFAALGMALCDQGKYDAALAPLEKSLQLDSNGTWETRWALANAYYKHEQYDEALKSSQEALSTSNGSAPEIALLVAQSLTAVGRYEDAAQVLREFLRDHGDRQEAATARRWLDRLTASGKIRTN